MILGNEIKTNYPVLRHLTRHTSPAPYAHPSGDDRVPRSRVHQLSLLLLIARYET